MDNLTPLRVNRLKSVSNIFPASSNPADPSWVEGRRQELRDAILTILTPRMCPVVLGSRGAGKTTLAWQLELALKGSTDLLDSLGLDDYRSPAEYFHETSWLNCARLKSPSGQGVLDAVLDFLRNRSRAVFPGHLTTVERSTTLSLSMTPKIEMTSRAARAADSEGGSLSAEEEILELATDITSQTGHPFLFIIDDIHLLEDSNKFCAFIKNSSFYSPSNPKFLLIGTADRLGDLLDGGRDVGSVVASIELGRLPDSKILELLQWGMRQLKAEGYLLDLEHGLLESLTVIAAGQPSTASQLARDAIIAAERNGSSQVARQHLDIAVRNLIASLQPPTTRRLKPHGGTF